MDAAVCWHGNEQPIVGIGVFLASTGAINPSRVKEISTLRQFVGRISDLGGIHRYDAGKNMEDLKLHS